MNNTPNCPATEKRLPVPDPTELTTQQLHREAEALKAIFFTRLEASKEHYELVRGIIETRLNAMDRAIDLLQSGSDLLPGRIDEKIAALGHVHDEKFNSIEKQFRERDVRTEQSSKDGKVAVDAALQAAKEAVGEQNKSSALAIAKSEASTVKQIDQITQLIINGSKGADDKINDVKERLTRVEGKGEGKVAADTTHQTSASFIVSIVSAIIALSSVAFAITMALVRK